MKSLKELFPSLTVQEKAEVLHYLYGWFDDDKEFYLVLKKAVAFVSEK